MRGVALPDVARRIDPVALATGFFTVWAWGAAICVGPRRALPLLGAVAGAGLYLAHVRPREFRIPLRAAPRPAAPLAPAPSAPAPDDLVLVIGAPSVAVFDAVVHTLPFALALALGVGAGKDAGAGAAGARWAAPIALFALYCACNDPCRRYNIPLGDVLALIAVYVAVAVAVNAS